MKDSFYQLTKAYVIKLFTEHNLQHNLEHLERTEYWIDVLVGSPAEAMRIAAFAHDIERTEKVNQLEKIQKSDKGYQDEEHLSEHQNKGAKIIKEFLESQGAPKKLIDDVVSLISHHEVGGDENQNILKDADSISFFETNAKGFVQKHVPEVGVEKVRKKFEWMYNRINSGKAQKIAKPMFEKLLKELNSDRKVENL